MSRKCSNFMQPEYCRPCTQERATTAYHDKYLVHTFAQFIFSTYSRNLFAHYIPRCFRLSLPFRQIHVCSKLIHVLSNQLTNQPTNRPIIHLPTHSSINHSTYLPTYLPYPLTHLPTYFPSTSPPSNLKRMDR